MILEAIKEISLFIDYFWQVNPGNVRCITNECMLVAKQRHKQFNTEVFTLGVSLHLHPKTRRIFV